MWGVFQVDYKEDGLATGSKKVGAAYPEVNGALISMQVL